MRNKLFFVERPEHVETAMDYSRSNGLTPVYIALSPNAGYEFEKRNIRYRDISDFVDYDELAKLDTNNYKRVKELCEYSDSILHKNVELLKNEAIECTLMYYYYMRRLITNLSMHSFLIDKVFGDYPLTGEVFFFTTKTEEIDRDIGFKKESLWTRLLEKTCKDKGLHFCAIDFRGNVFFRPGTLGKWNKYLLLAKRFVKLTACMTSALRLWGFKNKKRNLFVLNEGYDLKYFINENKRKERFLIFNLLNFYNILKGLGNRFGAIRPKKIYEIPSEQLMESCKFLLNSSEFKKYFSFYGIDAFDIVKGRLKFFYGHIVPEMIALYNFSFNFMKKYRPVSVMATAMGSFEEKIISHSAHKLNIPFIVWQHGELGLRTMGSLSHYFWYYTDFRFTDYFFAYGSGLRDFCKKIYPGLFDEKNVIPIGSTALDDLKRRLKNGYKEKLRRKLNLPRNKKVVIYPLINLYRGFAIPPSVRSDSDCFRVQKKIIDFFGEFKNIIFIIKPGFEQLDLPAPIIDYILNKKMNNCKLVYDYSFLEMVPLGDAFVLDWASTCFLESLATDKPIFVTDYLLNWEWQPLVRELFNKRIFYEQDLDVFLQRLRNYLKKERYETFNDDTLLKLYGTYTDDGKSSERALDFIANISKNEQAHG